MLLLARYARSEAIIFLNPDYVAARQLRLLRSNKLFENQKATQISQILDKYLLKLPGLHKGLSYLLLQQKQLSLLPLWWVHKLSISSTVSSNYTLYSLLPWFAHCFLIQYVAQEFQQNSSFVCLLSRFCTQKTSCSMLLSPKAIVPRKKVEEKLH